MPSPHLNPVKLKVLQHMLAADEQTEEVGVPSSQSYLTKQLEAPRRVKLLRIEPLLPYEYGRQRLYVYLDERRGQPQPKMIQWQLWLSTINQVF